MAADPQDAPPHAGQVVRRVLLRRNIAIDAETAQLVAAAAKGQACLDGVATQPVKLNPASTLVGRSRTMSSPGTPLRFPNSSARSGPI